MFLLCYLLPLRFRFLLTSAFLHFIPPFSSCVVSYPCPCPYPYPVPSFLFVTLIRMAFSLVESLTIAYAFSSWDGLVCCLSFRIWLSAFWPSGLVWGWGGLRGLECVGFWFSQEASWRTGPGAIWRTKEGSLPGTGRGVGMSIMLTAGPASGGWEQCVE